ncbi:ferrochelatase [Gilvimarinus sp. SDUM040013]|uniref:Ferrochelatase n=1 Tax=Gilvimarinus gilvus TaxID=3058038 RepID=A0ABU4RXB5_9GAMM|nr:ferrochelatase [Gilvimarinus sp. SDUM040013]MDO3387843.1 ferrochelatase [Gilvimarinus sp. SDUM040013]MDX6848786.1 ferrochelatase [Gilvimarinus sp. SDUM040013]
MAKYTALTENAHETAKQAPQVGVLLTNLGTPDAPDAPSLRRYLAEFLSDPRIIEIPKVLWLIILHGIILRVRPKKSAALYASVWTDDGSPLLAIAQKQRQKIAAKLEGRAQVALGMRYGNPSIANALNELQQAGVRKIIVLPLYPQYAAATVGSTFDAIAKSLNSWRWVPEISFISGYSEDERYIDALAASLGDHQAEHGAPQKWVFSYHGTPKFCLEKGDPYYCFCIKSTRQAAFRAGLNPDDCITTFQSRFGKAEWLKPYTDKTLEALPKEGIKNIAIVSPAFSADCLETLEELEVENREIFKHAGGESYRYIAALNDRDDHIDALVSIIEKRL